MPGSTTISGLSSADPSSNALVPVVQNSTTVKTTLEEAVGFWSTAAGDMVYANGARSLLRLPIGTSGQILQSTGGIPAWVTGAFGSSAVNLPAAAWQPTADPSSFASAQLAVAQSAGSVPSPRWLEWLFDTATAEYIVTSFICPPNYAGTSTPSLKVYYYSTAAVSSGVSWAVRIAGIATSGAIQSWAYGTTASISTFTVPTTAYDLGVATVPLTEGSSLLVAGRMVNLALFRNVAGGDAANGYMHMVAAEFGYS